MDENRNKKTLFSSEEYKSKLLVLSFNDCFILLKFASTQVRVTSVSEDYLSRDVALRNHDAFTNQQLTPFPMMKGSISTRGEGGEGRGEKEESHVKRRGVIVGNFKTNL